MARAPASVVPVGPCGTDELTNFGLPLSVMGAWDEMVGRAPWVGFGDCPLFPLSAAGGAADARKTAFNAHLQRVWTSAGRALHLQYFALPSRAKWPSWSRHVNASCWRFRDGDVTYAASGWPASIPSHVPQVPSDAEVEADRAMYGSVPVPAQAASGETG